MSVIINIAVEDVNDQLLTYSKIILQKSDNPNIGFSTLINIDLESNKFHYDYVDDIGTLSNYYRYRLSDETSSQISQYTNPFQTASLNRTELRQFIISKYRAGLVFETNQDTTESTIKTDDALVRSSAYREGRGIGTWLMPVRGPETGVQRIIINSIPEDGEIIVNPAYSTIPYSSTKDTIIEWHWLVPPSVWNEAINRACSRYIFIERVPVKIKSGRYEYPLTFLPWLKRERQVTGLWHYAAENSEGVALSEDEPWVGNGRWYKVREDQGTLTLAISPPQTKTIYLEAVRPVDEFETENSIIPNFVNKDLIAALAYDELLSYLTRPGTGSSSDRTGWRKEREQHGRETLKRLLRENAPRPRMAPSPLRTPSRVTPPYKGGR